MKSKILNIIGSLNNYDSIYIVGHNNLDADSYFSSYILHKILRKLGINAYFTILDNYTFSDENIELINDFLLEKPLIIDSKKISGNNFILVDHNDIEQSIKNKKSNVLMAIDHHIDIKKS